MKNKLLILLAMMLVLAICVPALAANETGGTTKLSYVVESDYTVVIPSAIGLTANDSRVLAGSGAFSISANSLIEANKTLKLAITGATNYSGGFYLVNSLDANTKISYTIADSEGTVAKDTPFLTATAQQAFNGVSKTLTVTSSAFEQAGTYSDTLTITVTLVDNP